MQQKNLAAIDLGTNSCRLMIADNKGNILYREAVATKLGEGMYEHMCFTDEAINRGLQAFSKYAQKLKEYDVGTYRAIATASCRMAKNGAEFVKLVEDKTAIKLNVIDGFQEAELNLKGALLNAPENTDYVVVYDLGGGSTEITLAKRYPEVKILHSISIPWGARNASEAFSLEEYNEKGYTKLYSEIKAYVDEFKQKSELAKYKSQCCLLATSSMPLRLISMANQWREYDRSRADGKVLIKAMLNKVVSQVYNMSVQERRSSVYIGENRSPIFVAGCVIFKTIFDGLGFDELTASLKGAQNAIIQELRNAKTYKISHARER